MLKTYDNLTDKEIRKQAYLSLERSEEILKKLTELNFVVVGSKDDPHSGLIKAIQRNEDSFKSQIEEVRAEFKELSTDVKGIKNDVSDLKTFQSNQKTGFALAKWALGGGFGLAIIGKFVNDIYHNLR